MILLLLALQDPWELAEDRGLNRELPRDGGNPGLWYGTPGVEPGNDLIGPLRELRREPRGWRDFRPRRVPGYVDPDLERFNRLYERGIELPRSEIPPPPR